MNVIWISLGFALPLAAACSLAAQARGEAAQEVRRIVVEDGAVLSGEIECESFVVPAGVTARVTGDFGVRAAAFIEIAGDLLVEDRPQSLAVVRYLANERAIARAPRVVLIAGERLRVTGSVIGGRGLNPGDEHPDVPDRIDGGDGTDISVRAARIEISGHLRGGDGGAGSRGGNGGRGGDVTTDGPAVRPRDVPPSRTHQIRGGNGGVGGRGRPFETENGVIVRGFSSGKPGRGGNVQSVPREGEERGG